MNESTTGYASILSSRSSSVIGCIAPRNQFSLFVSWYQLMDHVMSGMEGISGMLVGNYKIRDKYDAADDFPGNNETMMINSWNIQLHFLRLGSGILITITWECGSFEIRTVGIVRERYSRQHPNWISKMQSIWSPNSNTARASINWTC